MSHAQLVIISWERICHTNSDFAQINRLPAEARSLEDSKVENEDEWGQMSGIPYGI